MSWVIACIIYRLRVGKKGGRGRAGVAGEVKTRPGWVVRRRGDRAGRGCKRLDTCCRRMSRVIACVICRLRVGKKGTRRGWVAGNVKTRPGWVVRRRGYRDRRGCKRLDTCCRRMSRAMACVIYRLRVEGGETRVWGKCRSVSFIDFVWERGRGRAKAAR